MLPRCEEMNISEVQQQDTETEHMPLIDHHQPVEEGTRSDVVIRGAGGDHVAQFSGDISVV